MITQELKEPIFDGVGYLLHKILHQGWQSSVANRISYEDYFHDFVLIWLAKRHKYNPDRGAMTTFASAVAINYVRNCIQKTRLPKNQVYTQYEAIDVAGVDCSLTEEEYHLVETHNEMQHKRAKGLIKRLCKEAELDKKNLMETLENIQEKVRERQRPRAVALTV